ncbi:hypothetical protein [Heyndrickxia sporothermodurans]|nr:hypothetical protein [Heyndrickxia sporothermodurans]
MVKETLSLFQRDLFLGFFAVRFRWLASMIVNAKIKVDHFSAIR